MHLLDKICKIYLFDIRQILLMKEIISMHPLTRGIIYISSTKVVRYKRYKIHTLTKGVDSVCANYKTADSCIMSIVDDFLPRFTC